MSNWFFGLRRAAFCLVLATALIFAGGALGTDWNEEWERVLEAAKKEGEVFVYGPPGQARRKVLVEEFEKAYPHIEVKFVAGSGRKQAPRLIAEREAGKYNADILIGGTTTPLKALRPKGVLTPIEPFLILPEVKDPSGWFQDKIWYADNDGKLVIMFEGGLSNIIAINTNLVEEGEISSYWDLLDPKWKGKIVARDVRQPGPGGGQARFLYASSELGPKFLTRIFRDTDIALSLDSRQMVDWLAQGKYAVQVFPSSITVEKAIDQGLPVKLLSDGDLKEGAPMSAGWGSVMVADRAPHPNAAKVYLNWLLSKEGQTAWQTHTGSPSLRKDIPKDMVSPWNLPREEKEYFFGSLEDYMTIETRTVRKLISQAIEDSQAK